MGNLLAIFLEAILVAAEADEVGEACPKGGNDPTWHSTPDLLCTVLSDTME